MCAYESWQYRRGRNYGGNVDVYRLFKEKAEKYEQKYQQELEKEKAAMCRFENVTPFFSQLFPRHSREDLSETAPLLGDKNDGLRRRRVKVR